MTELITTEVASAATIRRGYYLVRQSDGARFFISQEVDTKALERVADRTLSDAKGWEYWIDFCLGLDVAGQPAWTNIDQVDAFI